MLACAIALNASAARGADANTSPVYPGKTWTTKKPADVSLDAAKLDAFARLAEGRGCVIRHGYLVYTWGDAAQRADVASACKPVYSHFLFAALEANRIPSLDEAVVKYEPRLADLNADLDHKDRQITWRHLANQVSCYGVNEKPGEAFDYSDMQMALFWDLLFTRVYGATYTNVDAIVLHPMLTDVLGCEDNPTMMAFGTKNRPGRLAISPRDFARFGLLYLRKGRWGDTQVISEEHAVMAVTSPLPLSIPRTAGREAEMLPGQRSIGGGNNQTDHNGSYSWLWWLNGVARDGRRWWPDAPTDMYCCLGHGGKRGVAVFPSLDLIVSWNDAKELHGRDLGNEAFTLIADAAK
ncbi:MAG: hypothetical protein GC159_15010 [Phycisphaera sp.]|nr:hypothetical protein [Phycisphaera sp.]